MSTNLAFAAAEISAGGGRIINVTNFAVALAQTDDVLFAFAASLADGNVDEEAAGKFAKNHGFLKGLMQRVRNAVVGTNPDGMSTARKAALAGSILFICTALRLAVTQPEKFGRLGADTAKLFLAWVLEMGKFVQAVSTAVGGWLLRRMQSLLKYLGSLRAPLAKAAMAGAYRAGKSTKHFARNMR